MKTKSPTAWKFAELLCLAYDEYGATQILDSCLNSPDDAYHDGRTEPVGKG